MNPEEFSSAFLDRAVSVEEGKRISPFESLSHRILKYIFQYLSSSDIYRSIILINSVCCDLFSSYAHDSLRHIDFDRRIFADDPSRVAMFFERFFGFPVIGPSHWIPHPISTNLETISAGIHLRLILSIFSRRRLIEDRILSRRSIHPVIFTGCSSVRVLSFSFGHRVLSSFGREEHIDSTRWSDRLNELKLTFPNLSTLRITDIVSPPSAVSLTPLIAAFPRLRRLVLVGASVVNMSTLRDFALSEDRPLRLERLEFESKIMGRQTQLSQDDVRTLLQVFPLLRCLRVEISRSTREPIGRHDFSLGHSLVELEVKFVGERSMSNFYWKQFVTQFRQLRRLRLKTSQIRVGRNCLCREPSYSTGTIHLLEGLPYLEELEMPACPDQNVLEKMFLGPYPLKKFQGNCYCSFGIRTRVMNKFNRLFSNKHFSQTVSPVMPYTQLQRFILEMTVDNLLHKTNAVSVSYRKPVVFPEATVFYGLTEMVIHINNRVVQLSIKGETFPAITTLEILTILRPLGQIEVLNFDSLEHLSLSSPRGSFGSVSLSISSRSLRKLDLGRLSFMSLRLDLPRLSSLKMFRTPNVFDLGDCSKLQVLTSSFVFLRQFSSYVPPVVTVNLLSSKNPSVRSLTDTDLDNLGLLAPASVVFGSLPEDVLLGLPHSILSVRRIEFKGRFPLSPALARCFPLVESLRVNLNIPDLELFQEVLFSWPHVTSLDVSVKGRQQSLDLFDLIKAVSLRLTKLRIRRLGMRSLFARRGYYRRSRRPRSACLTMPELRNLVFDCADQARVQFIAPKLIGCLWRGSLNHCTSHLSAGNLQHLTISEVDHPGGLRGLSSKYPKLKTLGSCALRCDAVTSPNSNFVIYRVSESSESNLESWETSL